MYSFVWFFQTQRTVPWHSWSCVYREPSFVGSKNLIWALRAFSKNTALNPTKFYACVENRHLTFMNSWTFVHICVHAYSTSRPFWCKRVCMRIQLAVHFEVRMCACIFRLPEIWSEPGKKDLRFLNLLVLKVKISSNKRVHTQLNSRNSLIHLGFTGVGEQSSSKTYM